MSLPAPSLHVLFGILLAGTGLLPRRHALPAAAGLAAFALGAGAFAVVPALVVIAPLAARLDAVGLSRVFVGLNVGMMLVGAGATMTGGLVSLAYERHWPARVAGGLAVSAALVVLALLVPLVRVAGFAAGIAAVAMVGAAAAAMVAGRGIAALLRRAAAHRTGELAAGHGGSEADSGAPRPARPFPRIAFGTTLAATLVALAAPHVLAIVAAALVAAVAGHIAARRIGTVSSVPVLPLCAAALLPFAWLLATIAGPVRLATASLPMVPLSPPAQALLAPALIVGAWGFLGVWPVHRWVPGPVLAAVGGALLLRVGAPALGGGLEHVQPVLVGVAALAAWHAALTRRPAAMLAAFGVAATAAIFSGSHVAPDARIAAAVLFATATAAAALRAIFRAHPAGRSSSAAGYLAARLVALPAGAAMYAMIAAGLRAEVMLTVVLAAAAAAAAWRLRTPAQAGCD